MIKKLFFLTAFFAACSTWDIHAAAAAAAPAAQSQAELSKYSGLLCQELINQLETDTFQNNPEDETFTLRIIYTEMREDYKRFQQINGTRQQKLTWADFIEEQTNAGKALELLIQKGFITTPAQLTLALNALCYEVSAGETVSDLPKRFETIVKNELIPLIYSLITLHITEPTSELNQQMAKILWFIHTSIRKSNYIAQDALLLDLLSLTHNNIIQKIDIPEILNDLKKCIQHIPDNALKKDDAGNPIPNNAPYWVVTLLSLLIDYELINQNQVDTVFDLLNIYIKHHNYNYDINDCLQSLTNQNLIEPRHVHAILNFTKQEIKNQSVICRERIIPMIKDLIKKDLIRIDMLDPEQIRSILYSMKKSIDSFVSREYPNEKPWLIVPIQNYLDLFKTLIEKRLIQIEDSHIQRILKNIIMQMNSEEFKRQIESFKNPKNLSVYIADIDNIMEIKADLEAKFQEMQTKTAQVLEKITFELVIYAIEQEQQRPNGFEFSLYFDKNVWLPLTQKKQVTTRQIVDAFVAHYDELIEQCAQEMQTTPEILKNGCITIAATLVKHTDVKWPFIKDSSNAQTYAEIIANQCILDQQNTVTYDFIKQYVNEHDLQQHHPQFFKYNATLKYSKKHPLLCLTFQDCTDLDSWYKKYITYVIQKEFNALQRKIATDIAPAQQQPLHQKHYQLPVEPGTAPALMLKSYMQQQFTPTTKQAKTATPTTAVPEEIRMHPAAAPEPKKQ